ncbi:MAG: DNA-formamidopyrimidine glycosylase [Bacilli bacterium]
MPELVEVEILKRNLTKEILGKKINKVEVFLDKIVYNKKEYFIKNIENKLVTDVIRKGKWLFIGLEGLFLVIHFRMEGRLFLKNMKDLYDRHDYVVFTFDKFKLYYNDSRLFGKMEIIKKDQLDDFVKDKKLGIEYDDELLTSKYLKNKFVKHHVGIKKMLLDQSYITGIGNIYADEILFESKINPRNYANDLSNKNLSDIIKNTKKVFAASLEKNGTYLDIYGKRGTFEQLLMVHKRQGEKCYKCGSLIIKEKIGGRGTYYCPICQKM